MLRLGAEILPNSVEKIVKAVEQTELRKEKAVNTAIRITGFKLKRLLQEEVLAGAPGGVRFKPLSFIAKRMWAKTRTDNPLSTLAQGIRYDVTSTQPYTLAVGFVGPHTRSEARAARSIGLKRGISGAKRFNKMASKRIRYLATIHQQGFESEIPPNLRKRIIRRGGKLWRYDPEAFEGGDKPFFLKKSTRVFKTPARPIIDPFWQRHQRDLRSQITRNFKKKMAGERI